MLMLHDTAVMTVFLDPYLENLYLTKKQYNRKQRLKVSLIALIAEVFISSLYFLSYCNDDRDASLFHHT